MVEIGIEHLHRVHEIEHTPDPLQARIRNVIRKFGQQVERVARVA
jgi:hypothetical protein